MSLADLTSRDAVLRALAEFDEIGREPFLTKYGFGKSRSYFLVRDGQSYDSKAIAGVAHGYQHPNLGPLRPADFSGGDATVGARLEALGFEVVVTEPKTGETRILELFADYSRREVHDIFAPMATFTPGAGSWGLAGIVEHQPGEFVLFVTFGREQGEHVFDEGITSEGVVTWQSQPSQSLNNPQVRRLIEHDSQQNNVRLFLRTRERTATGSPMPYTYLGRLSYLTHDAERERPVFFQWQLIDTWPPPSDVLARIGLDLAETVTATLSTTSPTTVSRDNSEALIETAPPTPSTRTGKRTPEFRARKAPDRSLQDAKNRALGLAGEIAVVAHEQRWLRDNGRDDLARAVRHVAAIEGDGAGYDVASFEPDGSELYIEVKTTRGGPETGFLVSANEVEFSRRHSKSYRLYRVYEFVPETGQGRYYIWSGSLADQVSLDLEAVQFFARLVTIPTEP